MVGKTLLGVWEGTVADSGDKECARYGHFKICGSRARRRAVSGKGWYGVVLGYLERFSVGRCLWQMQEVARAKFSCWV